MTIQAAETRDEQPPKAGSSWIDRRGTNIRSGPKRFNDLKRLIAGISEKVLIQQLRELTAAGVLVRHDYQQVPPKVDHTMTAFGLTLVQALLPLCDWGTEHRTRVEEIMVRARRCEQTERAAASEGRLIDSEGLQ